jgi:hypothetical protein
MCGRAVATAPHFNTLNTKLLRPFFLHRKMFLPETQFTWYTYIWWPNMGASLFSRAELRQCTYTLMCIAAARQRFAKHIPTRVKARNSRMSIAKQQRVNTPRQQYRLFSVRSVPKSYKRRQSEKAAVEAGSNTSTVTLRVVGGDEKGSLKSETVK